jgi:hypothetical protein
MSEVFKALPGTLLIVNIVILLSALFFFTSTVASHLVEAWVGAWNSRGKQLRARLESALGKEAADALYGHALIRSISSGADAQTADVRTLNPPSYIEPKIFADAIRSLSAPNQPLNANAVVTQIRASVADAATQFEPKLLEWFKAINDHQTGVYTRWTFLRLITIGFLFAAMMDLDTVHITATLWGHPEQTEAVAKALKDANLGSGELDKLTADQKTKIQDAVAQAYKQLRDIAPPDYAWQHVPTTPQAWLAKLLGWLLTALATSLGAQFWFNIMSEALKLRAGPPKPKQQTQAAQQ